MLVKNVMVLIVLPKSHKWRISNYLMIMIKNLKFGKVNNVVKEQLKSDIEQTKNNNKVFVSADKCRNTWSYKKKNKKSY